MMIEISFGSSFKETRRRLSRMGTDVRRAISEGLAIGAKETAGHIAKNYLSGQALKRRSGHLAKAVDGWLKTDTEAIIGVRSESPVSKYKWLLSDEQHTIRPKKGKFLTIPVGEALTGAGVLKAQYAGGLRSITDGFFVHTKGGKLLFGYKRGKKGKFRALFTLVQEVLVQGTGALADGVSDKLPDLSAKIEEKMHSAAGGD